MCTWIDQKLTLRPILWLHGLVLHSVVKTHTYCRICHHFWCKRRASHVECRMLMGWDACAYKIAEMICNSQLVWSNWMTDYQWRHCYHYIITTQDKHAAHCINFTCHFELRSWHMAFTLKQRIRQCGRVDLDTLTYSGWLLCFFSVVGHPLY